MTGAAATQAGWGTPSTPGYAAGPTGGPTPAPPPATQPHPYSDYVQPYSAEAPGAGGTFSPIESMQKPIKDPDAPTKIGIAAALNIVPVIGPLFTLGYTVRYLQNKLRRDERLPEWSDFGDIGMKGLLAFLVTLPFSLIPFILFTVLMIPAVGSAMALAGNSKIGAAIMAIIVPMLISLAVAVVLTIPVPVALCRLAESGSLGTVFNFNAILATIKANPTQYLLIFALAWVAMMAVAFVSSAVQIVPVLGWIAGFVIMLGGAAAVSLGAMSAFGDYYARYRAG